MLRNEKDWNNNNNLFLSSSFLLSLPSAEVFTTNIIFWLVPYAEYIIIIIMALQLFVGPWPLFQFLDPVHSRYDPLDGGSPPRKASTYTQNNTNRKNAHNTDNHALSDIRTDDPSVEASEDSSCLRPHRRY
jgi:hypothetical protein